MNPQPIDRIRSAIKASLPNARIVLVGSYFYNEQSATSDYDLLVLTIFPVKKSKKQEIVARLANDEIKYDIHFIPRLFILLKWKIVAGKDLDSGKDIRLRVTKRVCSTVFASRIKMAYYYYLTKEYHLSVIALLRARILPYAVTDIDIFSFAGNMHLLEQIRSNLNDEEYLLYKTALTNGTESREDTIDTRLLLTLINETFLHKKYSLFQVPHNLQYYAYSIRRGSLSLLVNYNQAITSALYHYMNGDLEKSTKQLSKLTKVTSLNDQLKEYSQLSVLEMKN
jgi:predicted nucleotidyltransferase